MQIDLKKLERPLPRSHEVRALMRSKPTEQKPEQIAIAGLEGMPEPKLK